MLSATGIARRTPPDVPRSSALELTRTFDPGTYRDRWSRGPASANRGQAEGRAPQTPTGHRAALLLPTPPGYSFSHHAASSLLKLGLN
jgi:hypothetical protein